jgi:rhodanese-related sulfurtransferase
MDFVINLNAIEFSKKISEDKSAIAIDVRTPDEFNDGHIPGSILIDIYNPNFQNKIMELEKNKTYYIYCRSGSRSYHAGNYMRQSGFSNVYHLEEGILTWTDKLEK